MQIQNSKNGKKQAQAQKASPLEELFKMFPKIDRDLVEDTFDNLTKNFELTRQKLSHFSEEQLQEEIVSTMPEMTRVSSEAKSESSIEQNLIGKLDEHIRNYLIQELPAPKPQKMPAPVPPQVSQEVEKLRPPLDKFPKPKQEPMADSNLPCQITKAKPKKKRGGRPAPEPKQEPVEKESGSISTAVTSEEPPTFEDIINDDQMREVRGQVLEIIKEEIKDFRPQEKEQLSSEYFSEVLHADFVRVQKFIECKFEQLNMQNNFMGSRAAMDELFPSMNSARAEIPMKLKLKPTGIRFQQNPFELPEPGTRDLITELKKPHVEYQKQKLNMPLESYVNQTSIIPVAKANSSWEHFSSRDVVISKVSSSGGVGQPYLSARFVPATELSTTQNDLQPPGRGFREHERILAQRISGVLRAASNRVWDSRVAEVAGEGRLREFD